MCVPVKSTRNQNRNRAHSVPSRHAHSSAGPSQREPRPPRPSLSVRQRGRVRGEQILKEACSPVKESATCVQRFDDSLNSAIRITYRISLRSSSLREPRYPSLRVVQRYLFFLSNMLVDKKFWFGVVKKRKRKTSEQTGQTQAFERCYAIGHAKEGS